MPVESTEKYLFTCPQCKAALEDYAPACRECGCNVLKNDPLPPELQAHSINRNDHSVFFAVSPLKLVVMSVTTFGLYELFWFYKNWHYVKEHSNKTEFPLLNAVFRIVSFYYLMVEIRRAGAAQQKNAYFSPALLALVYVAINVCGAQALSKVLPVISLIGLLTPLPLIPVQKFINDQLNSDNSVVVNNRFSTANWVAIVIGGALMILSIVGTLIGPS